MLPATVVVAALALVSSGNIYGLANPLSNVARQEGYLVRRVTPAGASRPQSGTYQPLIEASEGWKVPGADKPLGKVLEHWLDLLPLESTLNSITFYASPPKRTLDEMQDLDMVWTSDIPATTPKGWEFVQQTSWYRSKLQRFGIGKPSINYSERQMPVTHNPSCTYEPPAPSESSSLPSSPGGCRSMFPSSDRINLLMGPMNITKVFEFYATEVLLPILQPQWQSNYKKCYPEKLDIYKVMEKVSGVKKITLLSPYKHTGIPLFWRFHADFFVARDCWLGFNHIDIVYREPQNGQDEGQLLALFPISYPKDINGKPTLNWKNWAERVSGSSG